MFLSVSLGGSKKTVLSVLSLMAGEVITDTLYISKCIYIIYIVVVIYYLYE